MMDRNTQIANYNLKDILQWIPEECCDIIEEMTGKNIIWKKRFTTNVLPYVKNVYTVGAFDVYQNTPEYKCDFCYEYFLTDFNNGCKLLNANNVCKMCVQHDSTYLVEMNLVDFQYFLTEGCMEGPRSWVKICRVNKFEDIKKIIKKIAHIYYSNFKLELKQSYEKFKL